MNSFASPATTLREAPRLRLLPALPAAPGEAPRPTLQLVGSDGTREPPVLVAGANPEARRAVLEDLEQTMPRNTVFEQASAFWEVLVRGANCSMVILAGELDEMPAESLMQMLAQRHPTLPVVGVAPSAQLAAGA